MSRRCMVLKTISKEGTIEDESMEKRIIVNRSATCPSSSKKLRKRNDVRDDEREEEDKTIGL